MNRWIVALIVVFSCLVDLRADDWPQWRGGGRDGVWHENGLVDALPAGQLPLDWSVEIGAGYSGPTVANGKVYVMDRQTSDGRQTERILCFASSNGKPIWTVEYNAPYTIQYTAGPRASVTVEENVAYAVGAMGNFHCLDAETGAILWHRDLNTDYDIDMPIWGIAASPLIHHSLVIQQVAGSNGACIVAFEKSSGAEVWRALDERAGYSSPIVIQQAGQDVLVCWTGESLSGLDPNSGAVHWSHEMKPSRMAIGIGTPAVDGEMIFVSSFYDGSLMIRAPHDSLSSQLVWRAVGVDEKKTGADSVLIAGGERRQGGVFGIHAMIGTSIVDDGYVYSADSYGEMRCLNADDGSRIWEDLSAVPKDRWATIHMVQNHGRVWMFNERGELLIAKLTPAGMQIKSRAQLIEPTNVQLNQRGGVCWSHPAFAEKAVFARSDTRLVRASLAK